MANPSNLQKQARLGIDISSSLGIAMPSLRALARRVGKDHRLAGALWESGIREACILATLVDDPDQVSRQQMEAWAAGFRSWEVVDAACCNLFDRTIALASALPRRSSGRAGNRSSSSEPASAAGIAVHDRAASDGQLIELLRIIESEPCDRRNFVRKAVNWALRQIGKRNAVLNLAAIESAERIAALDCAGARWVASDALAELRSPEVRRRVSAD